MLAKIHKNEGKMILALCDSDISGKKFEDGNLVLDLTSGFYNGKEVAKEKLKPYLKNAFAINAVGKEAVQFLIDKKIIDKKNVKTVKNIPHAQTVKMSI